MAADSTSVLLDSDERSAAQDEGVGFLLPHHAQQLESQGVPADFALLRGVRSVEAETDLPPNLRWAARHGVLPGLLFPWRSPDGAVEFQLRPDVPVTFSNEGKPRKYIQPPGVRLLNVLGDPESADEVWWVEGTRQSLAAGAYAPSNVLVVGIPGCANALVDGLLLPGLGHLVDGRRCVVLFDADLTLNANVWHAAQALGQALTLEGASEVRYARVPGSGKQGLDDLLGQRAPDKRARLLSRIVQQAPASLPRRPTGVLTPSGDSERPPIDVTADRLEVIRTTVATMVTRWNGWRLFDHGDVISALRGHTLTPLDPDRLKLLLAETARFYRPVRGEAKPAWPDAGVISAVTASADAFDHLERVSRVPFVRGDGTVCQAPGYDAASRTMLVVDQQLGPVDVPENPTGEQIERARRLLLDEWLGDLPLLGQADRANVLALVLTPFIRGLVPLVPLAVVDGLQMGVGKNLLADCLCLVVTGENAEPLPYPHDDEELRKVITSTFGTGADMFVFDEAHTIEGRSLARALTATTWQDRILGVSRMAAYPNQVTWLSLGNQVQVNGDLARRVYRIALHPKEPNPESRQASAFRHPDLRAWTRVNRHRLIEAALTLVRAWFSAGSPTSAKGVSFGSFEAWDRMIGGILEVAGVPGFLDNVQEWRGESDFGTQYWREHLEGLDRMFNEDTFTTAEVIEELKAGHVQPPPGMDDFTGMGYSRELGKAYSRVRDRWFGDLRLVRAGKPGDGGGHGSVNKWRVQATDHPQLSPSAACQAVGNSVEPSEGSEGSPLPSRDNSQPSSVAPASPITATVQPALHPSHPSHPDIGPVSLDDAVGREQRLTALAARMSRTGLRVDLPLVASRRAERDARRRALRSALVTRYGFPEQAATGAAAAQPWATMAGSARLRRLADGSAWPRRPDGRLALGSEALALVQELEPGTDLAEIAAIIAALQAQTGFLDQIRATAVRDRVHPVYRMDTATGRWTSTRPNVLGVGKRTPTLLADRDVVLSEPGHLLVGADLSGIDARAVAGLAGDTAYAALFHDGTDVHAEMSELFYGDRQHREQAKAITHGLNYGRSASSISAATGTPLCHVKRLMAQYFEAYPGVRAWQDEARSAAVPTGKLPTGTGRAVMIEPERAHTQAPAVLAQAVARDLAVTGLLRLEDRGLADSVRLFIHDEIVLSVPAQQVDAARTALTAAMTFDWASPSGLVVPVVAQAHRSTGPRWSDLYTPPA